MTTEQNEFWGDEAGWSTSPDRDRTAEVPPTLDQTPARGIGGKASRLWGSLLSTGSNASRSHGDDPTGSFDRGVEAGAAQRADDHPNDAGSASNSNASDEEWDDGWDIEPEPASTGGVDPLLAKFGGAAVVLTLLIPVAIGFRSGGDEQLIEAATAAASSAVTTGDDAEPADTVEPADVSVATSTSDQASTASAAPQTAAPSTNAEPVDSVSSTGESRSASELSDSTGQTESSSGNIAAAAEAESTAVRVEPECPIEYDVVVGDFWIRIADGAGVDISELLSLNGASSGTPLYPGSTICLPAGASTPAPPATTAAPTTAAPTTAAPTTAAPTTAAPTTAAPPPPAPTAPADIERIIRDVWPDDLEEHALEIAWRESNYVPTAKNYCCYGLFQMYWDVHKSWLGDMGITSADQLYDPTTNARAAYALYQRAGGWGPWGG